MIIGLSGTLCSGKDTVAEYLEKNESFSHISLSDVLRELARENDVAITMDALTRFGNSIESKFGRGYLAKLAVKEARGADVVISSIRQPSEIEFLKQKPNFKMIFVDADIETRFKRLRRRARKGDSENFEEFERLDAKQTNGGEGGINLGKCKKMSDFILTNNGTLGEFEKKIDSVYKGIKGGM